MTENFTTGNIFSESCCTSVFAEASLKTIKIQELHHQSSTWSSNQSRQFRPRRSSPTALLQNRTGPKGNLNLSLSHSS